MRNTKIRKCHNRNVFFRIYNIKVVSILLMSAFVSKTFAQEHVSFWGMELGTDVKKDSVFMREIGCRPWNQLHTSFMDFSCYKTDFQTYISLHFSPITQKVSEVYICFMDDNDLYDYYKCRISNICGKPFKENIVGDLFWRIKNKNGNVIGEISLLKNKANDHSLGIILTDNKTHQEAMKESNVYSVDAEKFFSDFIDKSLERPKTLFVTHIDSLENCGNQLFNDTYVIYAADENGKTYKILSHYDYNEKKSGKMIKVNAKMEIKLDLYHFSYKLVQQQCSYFGNIIKNEPDIGLYNLHVTENLNGLYLRKHQK